MDEVSDANAWSRGRAVDAAYAGAEQGVATDAALDQSVGPFRRDQIVAGGYEILGLLGVGGMGVVYAARDRQLDRMVAIKAPVNAACAEALRHEAIAMAAVSHPNLIRVHAFGSEADVPFLIMERVFGMTLEDRIAEAWTAAEPIPIDEGLSMLIAITDAITAVHRAGLAHRDVKSANVMLNGQRVVLADFGLAKPEVGLHRQDTVAGTVDYMAPELILHQVRRGQGPLVDLYALGVVAFEVLAGRRPFEGASTHAVLTAHIEQPVPDIRAHRGDVPEELAVLVHQLLAKAPEDRPEASEAVLWRLQAIVAERPQRIVATPTLSVLIVDDDPDIGNLLKRSLQWTLPRLVADAMTDPGKALDRIRRRSPDIAVVDLNMPGMNGVELCMNLSALPWRSRPVVVAMSGRCSHDDLALLRTLDVYEFVRKDEGFLRRMCDVVGDVRRARFARDASPTRLAVLRR